jgi:hypothetical protein
MGISDNELDEIELDEKEGGGGRRCLFTKSFGQRTDLNVFERRANCQLIGRPVLEATELLFVVRDFCAGSYCSVVGDQG